LNVLLGVSPARTLLAAPDIDVADFAVRRERAKLLLGNPKPDGGLFGG
jgi:hypothetical protein